MTAIYRYCAIAPLSLLVLVIAAAVSPARAAPQRRQVLLLHSYHQGYRWTDGVTAGVLSELGQNPAVQVVVEHMDAKRFASPQYQAALSQLYVLKFGAENEAGLELAAVICSDDHSLDFVLEHRRTLFAGVPVVFCGINDFRPERIEGYSGITGVVEHYDFSGTLGEMLRLHPKTRSIAVIGDHSKSGKAGIERLRRAALPYSDRVRFDYFVGLPVDDLVQQLAALPEDALVLHVTYVKPDTGPVLTFDQGRRLVADASPVPVYCPWDYVPDQGLLGGRGLSGKSQGSHAGRLVRRILNGEAVDAIPVESKAPNPYMFDHGLMQRFGISEEDLPEDSLVVGRPQSLLSEYWGWLVGMLVFFALQSGLIIFLFVLRIQRKRLVQRLVEARKMEAIGLLAGGVAHDFRNQLTVIGGYCDMLQDMVPPGSLEAQWLDQMRRGIDRSSTMTRQLLAFSRKEALHPKIIEVNSRLGRLTESLARLIGEDIELRLETSPGPASTEVDAVQFEQAVMNLVSNARDAMPGGGRLLLRVSSVALTAADLPGDASSPPGDYVRLDVEDNGSGMSDTQLKRIFDPFYTTKGVGKGTGLGLSMVHGFVHQSGGFIRVHSSPDDGTRFSLFFPACLGDAEPTEEFVAPEDDAVGHGERILVVEDDEAVLELVGDTLRSLGYNVSCASSAEGALKLVKQAPPFSLLVTDVVMPQMYGPDLAARLQVETPGLKLLYMSGYTRGAFQQQGPFPSHAELLEKPFSRDDLNQAVRNALGLTETASTDSSSMGKI